MWLRVSLLSLLIVITGFTVLDIQKDETKSPIDLNHWKVTLPIGKPIEVSPPEILDYESNEVVKPYMYNDPTDNSLVFYTVPGKTTKNTKYSRTELREQMVPGSNSTNWTFPEGGRMVGELKIEDISKQLDGKYHKTIIMQIHGRLSNEQRELIGKKDNDAPPILKIYWKDGKVRVKVKKLKSRKIKGNDILLKSSWTDDEGHSFEQKVDFDKFKLEVIASNGKLEVILNDKERVLYSGFHMKQWSVFENYFKAGNYFQTRDSWAFCKVKYYSLEISHPE